MAGEIIYKDLTPEQKELRNKLLGDIAGLDGLLADIQTEQATAQTDWDIRRNNINKDMSKLKIELQNLTKPTITAVMPK